MCGRFALIHRPDVVDDSFGVAAEPFPPRYNIAPTQPIMVVSPSPAPEPGSNRPARVATLARWGFIPGWVKDVRQFPLLINARSETAATKASFRAAMRHRRVLIPASGFYEWKRIDAKRAQAYWIRPRDGGVVAFGGLLETYIEPGGSEIDTAAILTTAANGHIAHIHDRMPVVVKPEQFGRWLDCLNSEPRDVADIVRPVEPDFFEAVPVSDKVNKVANTSPDIQDRVEPRAETASNDERPAAGEDQLRLF